MLRELAKISLSLGITLPRVPLYAYLESSLLRDLLHRLMINCVLDVGANKGQFATRLRRIGYKGYIVSFEPSPDDYLILCRRFVDDPLWQGFNFALGNDNTTRSFNINVECTEMSSFLQPRDNWALQPISVEMKRLDSIFNLIVATISKPHVFLKMDTQGYDLEVVKGARKIIERISGLQSELSVSPTYENMPTYLDALGYYEELGFTLVGLNEAAYHPVKNSILELNCIMARMDAQIN